MIATMDQRLKEQRQRMFDTVFEGVFKQGRRAWTPSTNCRLRVTDGDEVLKCAVGHLIPDDLYSEMMPNSVNGIISMSEQNIPELVDAGFSWENARLLDDLLNAHDNPVFMSPSMGPSTIFRRGWCRRMVSIAADHGLDSTKVKEALASLDGGRSA